MSFVVRLGQQDRWHRSCLAAINLMTSITDNITTEVKTSIDVLGRRFIDIV
jgi:hypothetical protein